MGGGSGMFAARPPEQSLAFFSKHFRWSTDPCHLACSLFLLFLVRLPPLLPPTHGRADHPFNSACCSNRTSLCFVAGPFCLVIEKTVFGTRRFGGDCWTVRLWTFPLGFLMMVDPVFRFTEGVDDRSDNLGDTGFG